MTAILKNYFQIKPQSAFGYSLGEISMMLAQGIWTEFQEGSEGFNSSSLLKTRLSGPKMLCASIGDYLKDRMSKAKIFGATIF